jgi:hypothetical protein
VRTAVTAALITVTVGAVCFSLQAAGLRQTPHANVVAARAATWLLSYRLVSSVVHVRDDVVRGSCYHGWLGDDHGSFLRLSNGGEVQAVEPATLISHRSFTSDALRALELGGCTHVLGPRLATDAQFDERVGLRRAVFDGRSVLALHLHELTIFVTPPSDRPVGVRLGGITSTIALERVRRA